MTEDNPPTMRRPKTASVPPRILLRPWPVHGQHQGLACNDGEHDRIPRPRLRPHARRCFRPSQACVQNRRRYDHGDLRYRIVGDGGRTVQHPGAGRHGDRVHLRLLRGADGGHGHSCRSERRRVAVGMGRPLPRGDASKGIERALRRKARRGSPR